LLTSVPKAAERLRVLPFGPGFICLEGHIHPDQERDLSQAVDRLYSAYQLLDRNEQTRASALRLLIAEELHRRQLSRTLHDKPAQSLAVARLQLEMVELGVPAESEELRNNLAEIRQALEQTIVDVRQLISDLSPNVLEKLGLTAALRQLVGRFQRTYEASLSCHIGELPPLDHRIQLVIYRTVQECLTNISTHSSAEHINLSVTAADGVLRLHLEDDGVGFDVDRAFAEAGSFGLTTIRERVSLLGGELRIESTPIPPAINEGQSRPGTEVIILMPVCEKNPSI
jgi:signal transduction histidine kinase